MAVTRTGLYARISLDRAGEGLGVARQVEDCRARAAVLGWEIAELYVDNDVSASSGKVRPEYQRLLADLEASRINAVVVYDLDRLTRRPAELEAFIDLSDRRGVALANTSGEVDLTTAAGRMVARIKGAVARQEAERIGERVRRQKQQRAAQGRMQGGRYRAYGYTRAWTTIPEEAEVVREVFRRRVKGESTTALARDLNARGLTTTAGGGWRQTSVASLVSKPHYAGLVALSGEIVGRAEHEPIVDEATWRAANSVGVRMQPGNNTRRHLLSGVLRCSCCSTSMVGQTNVRDPVTYRCNRNAGGCGRVSIRAGLADDVVVTFAMARESRLPAATDVPAGLAHAQASTVAVQAEIAALRKAHTSGTLDLADLIPLLNDARSRLRQVERQAAESIRLTGSLVTWGEWLNADLSARRALIGRHVSGVVVERGRGGSRPDPSRLVLHWVDGKVQPVQRTDFDGLRRWYSQRGSAGWVDPIGLSMVVGGPLPEGAVLVETHHHPPDTDEIREPVTELRTLPTG